MKMKMKRVCGLSDISHLNRFVYNCKKCVHCTQTHKHFCHDNSDNGNEHTSKIVCPFSWHVALECTRAYHIVFAKHIRGNDRKSERKKGTGIAIVVVTAKIYIQHRENYYRLYVCSVCICVFLCWIFFSLLHKWLTGCIRRSSLL